MAQTQAEMLCSGNGFAFLDSRNGICTCHSCYSGLNCEDAIPSKCGGTIQQLTVDYFTKVEKCKCSFNRSGPCCEKKKCAGSNPIPNPDTGKCNCSGPDLRSGEFCEKVKCKNGVTTVKNGNCDCGKFFTGKFCEKIRCLNHGWINEDKSKCRCLSRFSGAHCQIVKCEHGGRQHSSSNKCIDCMFVFTGDYCHEIHLTSLAMVVVPLSVLLIIVAIIIRAYRSKNGYSGAPSHDRIPPHLRNIGRPNPGASAFGNSAQPHSSSNENLSLQYRPVVNDREINNLANGFEMNFPSNWQPRNSSNTNQTVNHPNRFLDRPPSYDDPPKYEEVVKNLPHTSEVV